MNRHAASSNATGRQRGSLSDRGGIDAPVGHHGPVSEQITLAINRELSAQVSAGRLLLNYPGHWPSAVPRADISSSLEPPVSAGKPIDSRRMARVMAFVGQHIERNFSVADLAKEACMSPAHFARSFKVTTGRCPHEFVSRIRLALAIQMLPDRHLPISDIALLAGFSSSSNFSRAFRDATGMTPRNYRATT